MNKIGEGVHNEYKERASKGADVLWHVSIKRQNELAPGIPLHMSLKVFQEQKDMDLNEIKEKVEIFNIKTPVPEKLSYEPTIFTSKIDNKEYYMLLVNGTDKKYEEFYNSLKHCGTVYDKFMPHITIDKGLYDKIKKEGLHANEIIFSPLCVEAGTGNTIHTFPQTEIKKSEKISIIRDLLYLDIDLQKHQKALSLNDTDLLHYIDDNPSLEKEIINKHEKRLEWHFHKNKQLIDLAKERGLMEAYKAKSRM